MPPVLVGKLTINSSTLICLRSAVTSRGLANLTCRWHCRGRLWKSFSDEGHDELRLGSILTDGYASISCSFSANLRWVTSSARASGAEPGSAPSTDRTTTIAVLIGDSSAAEL